MTTRRIVSAAALLVASALLACRGSTPAELAATSAASVPKVIIESPSGRTRTVRVEVVRTPAELERGLMFRRSLGRDDGMLFVFPEASEHVFWMKNTLIPLDMIFIGAAGDVVGIVENAEPMTTTPRGVGAPSRYVLEVNGGFCAAEGVNRGDRARFEGVPGL